MTRRSTLQEGREVDVRVRPASTLRLKEKAALHVRCTRIRQDRGVRLGESRGRSPPKASKLDRARSRLYRGQILQVNMRLKALVEIYTMHSFALL